MTRHREGLSREGGGRSDRGGTADSPGDSNLVLLGEFGRAQGLRGEIRLKSHTADPMAIAGYGPLLAADGRRFVLSSLRRAAGDQPDMLVASVEGITTREAAEALNRVALHVPRERLGAAEEDEFFLADLIGLRVENEAGRVLGRIVAVPNYGGGELLEIAPEIAGPTIFVPFTKAFVPVVDVGGGRVVVAPYTETEARDGQDEPRAGPP